MNRYQHMRTFDKYDTIDITDLLCASVSNISSKIEDDILIIANVLDTNTCSSIIDRTDEMYKHMNNEYDLSQRDSLRFLSINKKFGEYIWQIIEDDFTKYYKNANDPTYANNTYRPDRPFGFGVKGVWNPLCINECFRFNKYVSPSTGFTYHRDACYVEDYNTRSIYTMLIYLNDCDNEGCTRFVEPIRLDKRKSGETVSEELQFGFRETSKIFPRAGTVVIFDHNRIHCGDKLTQGNKYVIRSDIVFRRISLPDEYGPHLWQTSEEFRNAVNFYQDAKRYEMNGLIKEASKLYEIGLSYRQTNYL